MRSWQRRGSLSQAWTSPPAAHGDRGPRRSPPDAPGCSGRDACYVPDVDVETARETIAAEPPPRLRLDELLRELGAHDGDPPPPRADSVTVGALVDKAAESGFG